MNINFYNIINIAIFNIKFEIKNSRILFFWFFIEPLIFISLFVLIFGNILQSQNKDYLTFIIIGKFCYSIFLKIFLNMSNVLRKNKSYIKKLNYNLYNYYLIDFVKVMLKLSIIIIFWIIYLEIFFDTNLILYFNFFIILISLIMTAFTLGLIFSIIYLYIIEMEIILSLLPLFLLFCSGVFFDLNDINNHVLKRILFLNPLAIFIDDARHIVMYETFNYYLNYSYFLILFFTTLLSYLLIKNVLGLKLIVSKINLNL